MNRFPWKRLRGRREYRSPSAGATVNVATQLSVLVGEFRNESMRWGAEIGDGLWSNAWQLDTVRVQLLRGVTSADDARQWVAAGWSILNRYQNERARRNHPAGKAR